MPELQRETAGGLCRVAVIWIDWYPYHVARFRGLYATPSLAGKACGIEMVGGVGVHAGLKFRSPLPEDLPITSLMPESDWASADKWTLAKLLWRKLNDLNPETVLVPGYYTLPAIAAAVWARLHGRTSVLMTESASYDHVRSTWKELLKALTIRLLFQRAIAGGKDHIAYLRQLHFPDDRISRFYDVVDNGFFANGAAGERENATAGTHGLPEKYFLYVGRLAREKNVRGLLAAWLAYRHQGGTWGLVLAGDGPERKALEDICRGTGYADDVVITGLRTATQLLPLYAFASCFVLASTREPWGLVVNEAMAAGLPVIVSDRCGCANDLVRDAGCGDIVPAGDTLALTRSLLRMAQQTEELRASMGRRAWERVRHYSPSRFGLEVSAIVASSATPLAPGQTARQS